MGRSSCLVLAFVASCYTPKPLPHLAPLHTERAAAKLSLPTGEPWRLDEAATIAYALEHSPLLAERADAERIADATIGAARQLQNPELRIGQSFDDRVLGTSSQLGLALRIHPDAPWTVSARVARARAERDAERASTASTARALIAEIRELYADLAFGEAMQGMLDHQLSVLRERNRVLAERMEHATATRLENLLADHELADLEGKKSEVDLELVRARSKLAQIAGIPPEQPWQPTADRAQLTAVHTGFDAVALSQRALAVHPELAEAAARANAAGAEAYEEKTKRLPALDWIQIERTTSPEVEWSVGASFTLPLLSLNSGKIAVANAEQRQYLNQRDRLSANLVQRVREAVELAEATGKRARDLSERLSPLNAQIEELLNKERTTASTDPIKLLLLEERHVRAQRDMLDASYAHRRALIDLELVVGGTP